MTLQVIRVLLARAEAQANSAAAAEAAVRSSGMDTHQSSGYSSQSVTMEELLALGMPELAKHKHSSADAPASHSLSGMQASHPHGGMDSGQGTEAQVPPPPQQQPRCPFSLPPRPPPRPDPAAPAPAAVAAAAVTAVPGAAAAASVLASQGPHMSPPRPATPAAGGKSALAAMLSRGEAAGAELGLLQAQPRPGLAAGPQEPGSSAAQSMLGSPTCPWLLVPEVPGITREASCDLPSLCFGMGGVRSSLELMPQGLDQGDTDQEALQHGSFARISLGELVAQGEPQAEPQEQPQAQGQAQPGHMPQDDQAGTQASAQEQIGSPGQAESQGQGQEESPGASPGKPGPSLLACHPQRSMRLRSKRYSLERASSRSLNAIEDSPFAGVQERWRAFQAMPGQEEHAPLVTLQKQAQQTLTTGQSVPAKLPGSATQPSVVSPPVSPPPRPLRRHQSATAIASM